MAWTEKYCDVSLGDGTGGDGSSGNPWTVRSAVASAAAGDRVNIKMSSTAMSAGSALTLSNANATTTAPIWFRGYKTTIGDLDNTSGDASTPSISMGTNLLTFNSAYFIYSNLYFTGSRTAGVMCSFNAQCNFVRCRFTQTGNNANSIIGSATPNFIYCYFSVTHASADCISVSSAISGSHIGCVFTGGNSGLNASTGSVLAIGCIFYSQAYGINYSGIAKSVIIFGNTFYSITNDAIKFASAPSASYPQLIANNIFSNSAYGVNQASGGNIAQIARANNMSYSLSSGMETGFGDYPAFFNVAETNAPFTSTTANNADFLKLVSGCAGKATGLPSGLMEGLATQGYMDIGALQRQEAASSGGLAANPIRGYIG